MRGPWVVQGTPGMGYVEPDVGRIEKAGDTRILSFYMMKLHVFLW